MEEHGLFRVPPPVIVGAIVKERVEFIMEGD
jgi:hypothetical protein